MSQVQASRVFNVLRALTLRTTVVAVILPQTAVAWAASATLAWDLVTGASLAGDIGHLGSASEPSAIHPKSMQAT